MGASKVFGLLVHAPLHWPITSAANGGRQVRVVAAAPSKAAFLRLLDEAGCPTSMGTLNNYGGVTGNSAEVEAATAQPGILLRATSADNGFRGTYVPAEVDA